MLDANLPCGIGLPEPAVVLDAHGASATEVVVGLVVLASVAFVFRA